MCGYSTYTDNTAPLTATLGIWSAQTWHSQSGEAEKLQLIWIIEVVWFLWCKLQKKRADCRFRLQAGNRRTWACKHILSKLDWLHSLYSMQLEDNRMNVGLASSTCETLKPHMDTWMDGCIFDRSTGRWGCAEDSRPVSGCAKADWSLVQVSAF